ncbi:MAG: hypothetical protein A2297_06715 [Elusimicrobia bacterium RIFOXYB2_FULL_48_7]|nr:MAG: hypothetical protein A2297_06715 [Elusimicrobia bacterium RIFOXYB2_FULL_48_7]
MDNKSLQIKSHSKPGFKPVIYFEKWRVAYANTASDATSKNIIKIEKHTKTDEVFVLLNGKCAMIAGGNGQKPWDKLKIVPMKQGVCYNFPKNAWHGALMKKNSKILIVENRDTGDHNTKYFYLTKPQVTLVRKYKEYR